MRFYSVTSFLACLSTILGFHGATQSHAATRTRTATAGDLNVAASWGGGIPGINDIAKWDTVSASTGALGANTNWLGIELGAVTNPVVISATSGHTLTLGVMGIKMLTASGDLTISSDLILRSFVNQAWLVESGRQLTLSGPFTRGTASTVNLQGTGSVLFTGSGLSNGSAGIVGPWMTTGSGASTRYVTLDGANKLQAFTGQQVALDQLVNASVNYEANVAGTFGANSTANTFRYFGATGTINGNLTTNGILNSGTGVLTLGGTITIGDSRELVVTVPDATRGIEFKGSIVDNANGSSSVVFAHNTAGGGTVILNTANTYTGRTYIQSGVVEIKHSDALGSSSEGTTIYTANRASLRFSGGINLMEELTFVGADPNSTSVASLHNSGGTNTLSGKIILQDNLRIGGAGSANVTNITGGIESTNGDSRQLVFNPNSSTINFTQNSVKIGTLGSFYLDQVGTVNLEVGGNIWGKTVVANGRLNLKAENVLPTTSGLQMGVGYGSTTGVLDLNGYHQTIGRIEQAHATPGMITSTGAAVLTTDQGENNTTYTGTFQGELGLIKKGTGSLMLGGDNTHSGETVIMAGAFQLIKAEASTVAVQTSSSTSTITMDSTAGLQIGQHVTGSNISAGTFISGISGNTITLSRAPTAAVAGSLDFAALNGSLRNSTLNYNNQGGQLSFGTLTTTAELGAIKGAQNLALTNASSNAVALTVGLNGSSTAYSGIFSGAGSLVKDGEGSLTLTNASTFSGGTQVRAGALLIQNSGTASVLGSGSVSTLTNSGAVLGGSGSITGGSAKSITLNAGTFLRIGQTHNTAGIAQKLQLGSSTPTNVNISLAGTLQFDLFSSQVGTPEAEGDLLKLVSTSSISLNGGTVNVAALGDTNSWIVGDTWQLIDWAGTTQTGGLSLGLMPDLVGRTWTSYSDSNGFYVQLAAIPEPSKMILLLSGTLALGMRRQRSKRSA